ncbi:ArsR family transcriptional regulator [Candidatus Nitrosocosmicus hydrocola]|uniref:ArsR family transcriptional regulator n=1 Tax=Candidatus Nitrosocosmicus hydrocola TaxID=1826872 RepID=UPI0011E5A6B2|nr:ArsR family transcriptional regulator [Candidatus Nitrosocosmicus hydrocola]
MSKESNNNSKDIIDRSNDILINFEITENISKAGITQIYIERNILNFVIGERKRCIVVLQNSKLTIEKLCIVVRDKLVKKLEYRDLGQQILEQAFDDIEEQIVKFRDEIFLCQKKTELNTDDRSNDNFTINFLNDVKKLRSQFQEAPDPYNEWVSKVAEKYENLKKIFKKHYPEAWIFMEFCLTVKSILNVMDFTLPFMGVIVAPPSSMKTMVIQLFRKYVHVFYTDGFTPSSLVSHNAALNEEQLQKVDMLPKMKGRLVLTPELALFFTGKEDDLQKTMGIITRVLDGHGLENDSGAHGHRQYGDTMFVWLGAAVEIPFRVWKLLGTLGHKIYFIRPNLQKKTVWDLKRIAKNNNFSSINKEIEEALLDYLKVFDAAPEVQDRTRLENNTIKIRWNEEEEGEQDKALEYIAQLANLIAPLRGEVYVSQSKFTKHRSNYSNENNESKNEQSNSYYQQPHQIEGQDYDTDFPVIEDASRAVILLRNLAIGHAISQGRNSLTIQDVSITVKVALSTAPVRRVRVLDLLLKSETGELTTSQICKELSISQPVVTRTMREFEALKIANLSAVSDYSNSELKIKLNSEFSWFRTKEFLDLKQDFVPYDQKDKKNHDCDTQSIDDSDFENESVQNPIDKGNTIKTVEQCDNNNDRHTFIDNLPPQAQQKNDVDVDDCVAQKRDLIDDSEKFSTIKEDKNEKPNHNSFIDSSSSDRQNAEKIPEPLSGSESFEHVTLSHAEEDEEGHKTQYPVSPTITDSGGIKYIALQEILKTIQRSHGSIIAVNYAVGSVCKNNETVRNYLGDKLTSRENRNIRDIVSNVIRHPNIKIIKNKPQLLVKWFVSSNDSLMTSQKGETA